MKHKIAIFASGHGTNFQAIAEAVRSGEIPATVELMVCDQPGAAVMDLARENGVEAMLIVRKDYPTKSAFEEEIAEACRKRGVEYIFLAGYMRILGKTLLEAYPHRIVNLHPALLPSFTGLDAIGQAFRKGVKITGVTVHYVDEGMDTGPIIAQAAVPILDGDSIDSLTERVHAAEHILYPKTIAKILGN
ncbi:phosphoribosylglycinamide formyltransferase [Sporolactobacillus putidus]|uniref:Phosphoribosylglycinamide formyltransferase n=1 Tax=Sporolactobacillus putidus TaxID=492735 RepID=A0A917S6A1_9BACL|nr:phosphoribosylglycinamide formyltransferase [Sporolactobacillus putidus]GGL60129.1 phosphoribosylglycinamide formyltransferase [Sporolactobacillus putidus]